MTFATRAISVFATVIFLNSSFNTLIMVYLFCYIPFSTPKYMEKPAPSISTGTTAIWRDKIVVYESTEQIKAYNTV